MKYINTLLICIATVITMTSVKPEIVITGTVVDESGESLIGVNIHAKNSKQNTSTDIDGTFKLSIDQFPESLEFSYPGYEPQVYVINETYELEVVMEQSIELLEEIVVTGLKAKRQKKEMSYSVAVISSHDLKNTSSRKSRRAQKAGGISRSTTPSNWVDGRSNCYTYTWDQYSDKDNESYSTFTENQFIRPLDEALSTFSVDVDRASYGNVRRFIKGGQLPPVEAVRIEEMINYFEYDYPQPTGSDPIAIQSTLTDCPWNKDHQLLHIGLQGKKIESDNLPTSNFVFLIDVSGSMSDHNKLPLVKSSMKLLLNQLRPTDRVAIVTYAGADRVVLESTAASDKYAILEAIEDLDSGGSTAGARGIKTAYRIARANFIEKGNNRIILATDGDFNVGISSNDDLKTMIEKERKSGVFLSLLGYGMGNYQDDIMQTLAQAGNGNHAYIDDLQEAQKTLINEFGGTLFIIAKDVKLQLEFNPSQVEAYRLVGYETRMLRKEDFNNDKVDAGDMGSGHSVTAIYEIIPAGSKSTYLGNVDKLKYQAKKKDIVITNSDDIATIKFRYKQPDSDTSKKIEVTIQDFTPTKDVNQDAQWAIATATFGMKLRGSQFIDDLSYQEIIAIAKQSKRSDEEGYKAEMIRLIKSAKGLSSEYLATNE